MSSPRAKEIVYTLRGADETYRVFVERMREAAVTLDVDGDILYANAQFAELVGIPLEQVTSSNFENHLEPDSVGLFRALLESAGGGSKIELRLRNSRGTPVPVYLSAATIEIEKVRCHCVLAVDLREQKANEEIAAAERLARSIPQAATDDAAFRDCLYLGGS